MNFTTHKFVRKRKSKSQSHNITSPVSIILSFVLHNLSTRFERLNLRLANIADRNCRNLKRFHVSLVAMTARVPEMRDDRALLRMEEVSSIERHANDGGSRSGNDDGGKSGEGKNDGLVPLLGPWRASKSRTGWCAGKGNRLAPGIRSASEQHAPPRFDIPTRA